MQVRCIIRIGAFNLFPLHSGLGHFDYRGILFRGERVEESLWGNVGICVRLRVLTCARQVREANILSRAAAGSGLMMDGTTWSRKQLGKNYRRSWFVMAGHGQLHAFVLRKQGFEP